MKKNFIKFACGFAAAALAFTLTACDDSSSATEPSSEEISSESNGGEGSNTVESSATENDSGNAESSATGNSSANAGSSPSSSDSSLPGNSSASLDDNSSSSMAVTCQALTLECYSATQLCNKGLTEYCTGNSSSSSKETCKNVSNIDGGTCQDYDTVKDCETNAYAVCLNNTWNLAIIGDNCPTTGKEMTVNEINLICNDGYWKYKSTIDKCPPGSSCQRPNYSCGTHPINGFSCDKDNGKVAQLTISIWSSAGDCMYQCSGGFYHVVMDVAPVGN